MRTAEEMWKEFVKNADQDILEMLNKELLPIFVQICREQRHICSQFKTREGIKYAKMPEGQWNSI